MSRQPRVPALLAISDRRLFGGVDGLGAWARSLPAGIAVQLREKDLDRTRLVDVGRIVRRAFDGVLVVNGDLEIALACQADGVHLPSNVSWPETAVPARELGLLVGVSTHSPAEVEAASEAGAHYALFGPVFETPEKRRYGPAQGTERLRRAAARGLPVLGVGGVDAGNAASIAAAGAVGLAAIRAFADPRSAADLEKAWASSPWQKCVWHRERSGARPARRDE